MRKPVSVFALGLMLVLSGCASASGGNAPRSNSTIITREQLADLSSSTAYEIVQQIHPQWLIPRGQASFNNPGSNQVVVYLGSSRMGGPSELRNFIGSQLESIQFLDARQATNRLGSGHVGGAIILTQRK